ncbi:MAG: aldehyde dehydrogenase family protein [Gammaproteobacteria bacterium]
MGVAAGCEWSCGKSKRVLHSINPSTESIIADILVGDEANFDWVVQRSTTAFKKWRTVPAPKRGELVRVIAQKLREKKDLLGTLVAMEMGKSKQEGDGEVQEMIDMADLAVGQSRMLYGKTMHSERVSHRMYEQWHPYGVVGVISAFNFPMAVWSWNAFLAIIAGNTVIWKPSSKVALCAIAVQHLCQEAMTELGYDDIFSLFITDDRAVAEKLLTDTRIPLISFTGSTEVGRKVAVACANRFARCILELGGNNAVIVDESADFNLVIPALVFGAIGTAGQRCTSTRRVLVHVSRYQALVDALIAAYRQIKIGDSLNIKNLMGPLIDEAAVHHYLQVVEKIKGLGGKILFGGNRVAIKGYFVEPCLVEAKPDWPLLQQETFAPILYLLPYENFEDAVQLQNAVPQGLSSALFTKQLQRAEYFLSTEGSDCGIANVNLGTSGAEIGGACGGEKHTGGGREAGSDAW